MQKTVSVNVTMSHMTQRIGMARADLLMTIVVVALIVGLTLPLVTSARRHAGAVDCQAHLGQLAVAQRRLPPRDPGQMIWPRRIVEEAGVSETALRCPQAIEVEDGFGSDAASWQMKTTLPEGELYVICSYAINGWTLPSDPASDRGHADYFVKPAAPAAARAPVFGDAMWIDSYPLEANRTPPNLREGDRRMQGRNLLDRENMLARFTIARHGRGIHLAFLDGHVERVKLEDLKHLPWHEGWKSEEWDPPLPL